MKSIYVLLLLICSLSKLVFSAPLKPLLGGDSSGGGRGVFCTSTQNPHHGRLLDIYESYALWQLHPMNPYLNYEDAAELIATKMGKMFAGDANTDEESIKKSFKDFFIEHKQVQFIPNDQTLVPTDDSMEPVVPLGCEIKQVAVFYSNQLLLVDRNLWLKLTDLDKIGLLAHEYIYYNLREQGNVDSRYTRRIVGKIFSEDPFEMPMTGLQNLKDYYSCSGGIEGVTKRYEFYIYDQCTNNNCEAQLQFLTFASGRVFEKTIFHLNSNLKSVLQSPFAYYNESVNIGFRGIYTSIRKEGSALNELTIQSVGENNLFNAPPTLIMCEHIQK